jgi:hypothetical protein
LSWSDRFDPPILLPGNAKPLETILDAARYVTGLPQRERQAEHWRPAALLLKLAGESENGGDQLLARIAVMYGIRKGAKDDPPTQRRRKQPKAYRIVR